jgi:hypothetical protein
MIKKETCFHCGASMMENEYQMNRVLVRAMVKMAQRPGIPIRDLNLTKSEYSVISKLKHWNLAMKSEDGVWWLTEFGKSWLKGYERVPKLIRYFRNCLTFESEERILVWEVMPTEESKQKYRDMMVPYVGEFAR